MRLRNSPVPSKIGAGIVLSQCVCVCVRARARTVYSLASYISQGVVYILYVISSKHAVLSRTLSRKLVIVSVCTPSDTSRSKLTALPAAIIHISSLT
jgi:hypothetical protein